MSREPSEVVPSWPLGIINTQGPRRSVCSSSAPCKYEKIWLMITLGALCFLALWSSSSKGESKWMACSILPWEG